LLAAGYRRLGESLRPQYDRMFSPSLPPVERLRAFFKYMLESQMCLKEETGCVLGCPFASIGTELRAPEGGDGGLRDAIQFLVRTKMRYFESAIRDAMAEGSIPKGDAAALAQTLYLYLEGAIAHARIQNDLDFLKGIEDNGLRLIGFQPVAV
jgi:TetR/AcrR family transcriptional repressor of nem operon